MSTEEKQIGSKRPATSKEDAQKSAKDAHDILIRTQAQLRDVLDNISLVVRGSGDATFAAVEKTTELLDTLKDAQITMKNLKSTLKSRIQTKTKEMK